MKKLYILVLVTLLISGCSDNSDYIKALEERNIHLENEITELNERHNKVMIDKDMELKTCEWKYDQLECNQSKTDYELLKGQVFRYFELEHYTTIEPSENYDVNNQISVNDVKLFMTQDEVRAIYGHEYDENIVFDAGPSNMSVYWEYDDGTMFKFNPIYLISMNFSDPGLQTSMGIRINSNAKESLELLDSQFTRYSNIHKMDNSKDIFDFYYDEETSTIIYISVDADIWHYDKIDETSGITEIKIVHSKWDYEELKYE